MQTAVFKVIMIPSLFILRPCYITNSKLEICLESGEILLTFLYLDHAMIMGGE